MDCWVVEIAEVMRRRDGSLASASLRCMLLVSSDGGEVRRCANGLGQILAAGELRDVAMR